VARRRVDPDNIRSGTASGLNVHTDRRLRKMSQMLRRLPSKSRQRLWRSQAAQHHSGAQEGGTRFEEVLRSMFMEGWRFAVGLESGDVSGSECENESEGAAE